MEKWICLCVRMRKRRRKRKRGARLDVVGRNGTEEVYYAEEGSVPETLRVYTRTCAIGVRCVKSIRERGKGGSGYAQLKALCWAGANGG